MDKQDWSGYLKRYVWDTDKTPYFVPVLKLNQRQANSELFVYVCLVSSLFTVLGIVFCTEKAPHGQSFAVAFYCFSVACSAIVLHLLKDVQAALYCAVAPAVTLLFFLIKGFRPGTAAIDAIAMVVACVLILVYSRRVVSIALNFQNMPESSKPPETLDP